MNCPCADLPKLIPYDELSKDFLNNLEKIDTQGWYELYKCRECNQYWRINIWDKYQSRFAVKIDNIENWQKYDESELIKEMIVNKRGLQEKNCIMSGCKNKRLRQSVYCIDHAYENGLRK